MQIHELTATQLNEGLLDLAKQAGQKISDLADPRARAATQATKAAAGLQKQGYGPQYTGASARWQDKLAQIDQDPAAKQYIDSVARAWLSQRKLGEADANITAAPSAGAPTPAEQAKLQQMIQQKLAAQTPVAPAKPAAPDPYKQQFLTWSDSQLITRDPTSNRTITMAMVRKQYPDLAQKLNFTLEQIVTAKGTAQESAAVTNYIKLATAGVRAMAQAQRNSDATRGAGTVAGRTGQLNATPEELAELTRLAQKLGGVDKLIASIKRSGRP